ncbi:MAG: carboxypeptidase-like regulatory domain-containing protein [Spirosomataceae bacterium]
MGFLGVSVLLKGTSTGTNTDANGNFKITCQRQLVLVFSAVGLEKKEVVVGNNLSINVSLGGQKTSMK